MKRHSIRTLSSTELKLARGSTGDRFLPGGRLIANLQAKHVFGRTEVERRAFVFHLARWAGAEES